MRLRFWLTEIGDRTPLGIIIKEDKPYEVIWGGGYLSDGYQIPPSREEAIQSCAQAVLDCAAEHIQKQIVRIELVDGQRVKVLHG